jgi:MoxR-like ATPase
VREIYSNYDIKQYIINLVGATRIHNDVYLGSSPRGALALFRTSQALAAIEGRDYIIPDDVKVMAEATLAHRIILGPSARIKEISSRSIVQQIVAGTPIPGATVGARP